MPDSKQTIAQEVPTRDKPSEEMEHTEPADQLDEQMEKLEPTHQPKAKRRKLNRRRKTILSDEELSAVRNGNGLSDIHIVAAQNMMKEEFPELDGLESPLLNQVDGFTAITNSGVQIHHIKDHWVTSSCIGEEVLVYDSALYGKLSVNLTHQLAAVYKLKARTDDVSHHLVVKVPTVQRQVGGTDCGVFAIAFAYHAARGDDLSSFTFDQAKMRGHLVTCFKNGKLSPFPRFFDLPRHSRKKRSDTIVKLYCKCLMPDTWDNMILCDCCEGWFHFKCVDLPATKLEQWFCSDCVH